MHRSLFAASAKTQPGATPLQAEPARARQTRDNRRGRAMRRSIFPDIGQKTAIRANSCTDGLRASRRRHPLGGRLHKTLGGNDLSGCPEVDGPRSQSGGNAPLNSPASFRRQRDPGIVAPEGGRRPRAKLRLRGVKHRPGGAPERGLKNRQALDQKRRARYLSVGGFLSQAPGYAAIAWELMFPSPSFATKRASAWRTPTRQVG